MWCGEILFLLLTLWLHAITNVSFGSLVSLVSQSFTLIELLGHLNHFSHEQFISVTVACYFMFAIAIWFKTVTENWKQKYFCFTYFSVRYVELNFIIKIRRQHQSTHSATWWIIKECDRKPHRRKEPNNYEKNEYVGFRKERELLSNEEES